MNRRNLAYFFFLLFISILPVVARAQGNFTVDSKNLDSLHSSKNKFSLSVIGISLFYHNGNFEQHSPYISYLKSYDETRALFKLFIRGKHFAISTGLGAGIFNITTHEIEYDTIYRSIDKHERFVTFEFELETRIYITNTKLSPFFGVNVTSINKSVSNDTSFDPHAALGYSYGLEYRFQKWTFNLFMKKDWIIFEPKFEEERDWPVSTMPSILVGYSPFNE
jgi:hypothetical protein